MARYLNVLIVTELGNEAEIINKHSDDTVWARPFGTQLIGTRAKRIIRAYNPTRMREIYGREFVERYETRELEPTLSNNDLLPRVGRYV
jgi:hypothetical protein